MRSTGWECPAALRAVIGLAIVIVCLAARASALTGRAAPLANGPRTGNPADARTWRLGVLFWHDSPNDRVTLAGIQQALEEAAVPHELLIRQANSSEAAVREILQEFRELPVDLVFAMGTQAALLAAPQVQACPLVFTAVTNPVESGVVPSWGGSGTNVAGNSNWIGPETVLHVFRLAVPRLHRLGMLRSTSTGVVSAAELRGMKDYLQRSPAVDVSLVEEVIDDVAGIAAAIERLAAAHVDAVWIPIDFLIYENMDKVLAALTPHALPAVSSSLRGTEAGAVAGVYADYAMLGKCAVLIAVDILQNGRDPGSIPIGTMSSYQVIVNLGAARRCGYELPLSLLALADLILEDVTTNEARDAK
ncbi:MAG: ABC transporter substrate-binding protein [Planctomycetota bacterium]